MGAPCLSAPRSRSPAEQGAAIRKRVPILGRCFESSNSRNSCAPSAICADGSRQSCSPRLSVIPLPNSAPIKRPRWVSELAQLAEGSRESAIVSASSSSAVKPLHPQSQTSTRSR
jgi:hypothetical protein